jgi:hypothetical protein
VGQQVRKRAEYLNKQLKLSNNRKKRRPAVASGYQRLFAQRPASLAETRPAYNECHESPSPGDFDRHIFDGDQGLAG